ncbi:hypothetical protein [Protaetiibacter larvae]|uniref:Uncharacterized protein n=1 Tax=Protaetiibacter larvae TaxID=2592654 RepID=A0A5C1Y5W6_9MICO|nr:hypothetical protein [Protaetiibacter larvae]QEO08798.1 hypothetical protein FLP23_01450 [Protaetiibacter larvae]
MTHVDDRRLLASPSTPPSAVLYDYHERALQPGTRHEPVTISSEAAKATRLLTTTERATARITLRPSVEGAGLLHEAVARLRVYEARGLLDRMSVHTVARNLHAVFFTGHPFGLIHAARGWHLLEELDRRDLIEVWLDTPCSGTTRQWLRLRLCDRLDELRFWESGNANVHNR